MTTFVFMGSLGSCSKELPHCTGNCSDVIFEGLIYDKSTNQPLVNQPVNIKLDQNNYCLFCVSYKVGSANSGDDGHFKISADIDTSLLQNYHLTITATVHDKFLLYPEPVGPGLAGDSTKSLRTEFFSLDPVAIKNLLFGFYPKTLLKLNLHRTTAILPENPSLELDFGFDNQLSIWGLTQSNSNKDTTLTINTSANIYTKIVSRKFISASSAISTTDSILCSPNGDNHIDIYY